MDFTTENPFAKPAATTSFASSRRNSVISLLSPPPFTLLPLNPPGNDDSLFYGTACSDDEKSGSGSDSRRRGSASSSSESASGSDDDEKKRPVRRMSEGRILPFMTSDPQKGADGIPIKQKRRRSFLAFTSLRFSPRNLTKAPANNLAKSAPVSVPMQKEESIPARRTSTEGKQKKSNSTNTRKLSTEEPRAQRPPSISTTAPSTLSLLGTSLPDLAHPPSQLEIEPILGLACIPGTPSSTTSAPHKPTAAQQSQAFFNSTLEVTYKLASALVPPTSPAAATAAAVALVNAPVVAAGAMKSTFKEAFPRRKNAMHAETKNGLGIVEIDPLSTLDSRDESSNSSPTCGRLPSQSSHPFDTPPQKKSCEMPRATLSELGWSWNAAARRAFDHPPNRQKRISAADIDDDMLCDLHRIPSEQLHPFVFNASDPEIAHWSGFAAAYAAGEIDLENGLPSHPPRGVPDPTLCPFATPLECGPFRAPKPVWESDRQRAVKRFEIEHLEFGTLYRIGKTVAAAKKAARAPFARFAIIDADRIISLGCDGITEEPHSRQDSMCAHTIREWNSNSFLLGQAS